MKKSIFVILLLIAMPILLTKTNTALGQTTPEISVQPSDYTASSIGETFNLDVNVTNAEDVSAWEVLFRFDPSLIGVSAVRSGGFLSEFGQSSTLNFLNSTNFGYVQLGENMMGPEVASGNGTLVKINLTVNGGGRCGLQLYNTSLLDSILQPIDHTVTNGTFVFNYVALTPEKGNGAFAVEGFGFTPNSTIDGITWNGTGLMVFPTELKCDGKGNFKAMAIVPSQDVPGNYTVSAEDSFGENAEAMFTVLSIVGPQGPAGTEGAAGAQGPAGSTGPAGPAGTDASAEYTWGALILAIVALVIAAFGLIKKK